MHESPRSIRPSWIGFGWFIAAALTSLLLLALDAFGILIPESEAETFWVALAFLVGFFVAGFFVGTRVAAAPILHGVAIGLFSLVVWTGVNLVLGEPTGEAAWRSLDPSSLAGLIVLQTVAATVGTRIGVRWLRSTGAAANGE